MSSSMAGKHLTELYAIIVLEYWDDLYITEVCLKMSTSSSHHENEWVHLHYNFLHIFSIRPFKSYKSHTLWESFLSFFTDPQLSSFCSFLIKISSACKTEMLTTSIFPNIFSRLNKKTHYSHNTLVVAPAHAEKCNVLLVVRGPVLDHTV